MLKFLLQLSIKDDDINLMEKKENNHGGTTYIYYSPSMVEKDRERFATVKSLKKDVIIYVNDTYRSMSNVCRQFIIAQKLAHIELGHDLSFIGKMKLNFKSKYICPTEILDADEFVAKTFGRDSTIFALSEIQKLGVDSEINFRIYMLMYNRQRNKMLQDA